MVSSIIKSIALATLIATPISLAFTASTGGARHASTSLYSSSSSDDHDLRRQRLRDGLQSREEELTDIDLPLSSASHFESNLLSENNNDEPRSSEFHNLEPLPLTPTRRTRLENEARSTNIYTPSGSDPYWKLRDEITQLQKDLQTAMDVGVSESAVNAIRGMLRRAQSKDPEHVYQVTKGAAWAAGRSGKIDESKKYMEECMRARKMLPQFNLEGLWVGKYGSHGFEMINVTYSGDILVAYKVTGDQNIPRGEISFTADLSPVDNNNGHHVMPGHRNHNLPGPSKLDPILLSESSAKKWGTTRLPRFPGQGHAAEPGFVNNQFMEGQLVVIGEGNYFSFAWVPLEHQIFFGRPSPELTLKMLREGGGSTLTAGVGLDAPDLETADVKEQTEYVSRCLEVTDDTLWDELNEGKVDPFSCIFHGDDAEHCYFE